MLKTATILAVGYVLGARAGRDRYDQIKDYAQQAAARLEEQNRQRATTSSRR